jgi:uncharacterized OB-fold protein
MSSRGIPGGRPPGAAQSGEIPAAALSVGPVQRDDATAEFFDAAARGVLLLRCCPEGHFSEPAVTQCTSCASTDLGWAPASGGAAVISWTVTHPSTTLLVIAELDEGPWWWSQLVGAGPADLSVGTRLTVSFRPAGDEHVPVFELPR